MQKGTGPQDSTNITIGSDILQQTQLELDSLVEDAMDSLLPSIPVEVDSSPTHAEEMVAMRNRIDGMEVRMESRLDRLEALLENIMVAMVQQQKKTPSKEVMNPLGRAADGQISMQEDASVSGREPGTLTIDFIVHKVCRRYQLRMGLLEKLQESRWRCLSIIK